MMYFIKFCESRLGNDNFWFCQFEYFRHGQFALSFTYLVSLLQVLGHVWSLVHLILRQWTLFLSLDCGCGAVLYWQNSP